ncbi:hypothetical protein [Prosthecobacter sp.]|uniref:hypothetical protein n=1 Tax=Prosthecobacter sp. TaxID=1965333 RepID=UPI003782D79B
MMLHQFGKEFRYLRVRWCVLLLVVLLDLAVQMEWVLPMRPLGTKAYEGVFVSSGMLMRLLLWMVVWWFMLSAPPEDGGGRGHVLTRPLGRMNYWAGRLLVWVLLVMAPLLLEITLYLLLNGRPFSEVMLGVAERAWAAGSMTLWLLPLPLLLRGWERYAVIVLVVLSKESLFPRVVRMTFEMLNLAYDSPQVAMEFGRNVQAAWLVGLLVPVVVLWHQRRALGVISRLGAVMLLMLLQQAVAASALFANSFEEPRDPELIRRLTAGREVVIPERERRFAQGQETGDESDVVSWRGEKYIELSALASLKGMPGDLVPQWGATTKTMKQNGEVMPAPPEGERMWRPLLRVGYQCMNIPAAPVLPGAKPPGLLTVDVNPKVQNLQTRLPQPARLDEAVDLKFDLKADWARVRRLGEMPLKAGARFASPDFEVELLEVRPNMDGRGNRTDGCVTLVYRMAARSFEWKQDLQPWFPHAFIMAEEKRLMWQFTVHSGYEQMRGANLGWCRLVLQQTFQRVLEPGTGVTAENLAEQRLVWVRPEYLGSSRHALEMKDVTIGKYLMKTDGWPESKPAVVSGNPREAFLKQVRGLARPAEDAGREEMARYVAEVYEASHVFKDRILRNNEGDMQWPGNDQEVCVLLAPFLMKHPDLFRAALQRDNAELTQGVLHEALLQTGVPGVTRNEKTGGAMYEREAQVPGRPGQKKMRTAETLWLASWRPDDLDAYVEAMRRHSDEPLWPLLDDQPLSADEVLRDYPKLFDPGDLRWLMKRPDPKYREKAEKVTREAFEQLPAVVNLDRDHERALHAAVALGMPEALDWVLRGLAFKEDDQVRNASVMMGYVAMFGPTDTGMPDAKTLRQFLHDVRVHGAKDYRYDAVKMTWKLMPERP